MRRLLPIALILLLALPATARRRAVSASDALVVPAADSIAAAALAEGLPGLTIAVRKGTAVFIRSYGVFEVEAGTEARPEDVYQIASVSKQFTAAAIMRLEAAGRLGLNDRAGLYLPELDQRFDAITIRHLLNHSSGLADYLPLLENAFEELTQAQVIALITRSAPQFAPGSSYAYSNSGYFLLGVIIERASSRTYEQYLRETFFAPLGLQSTSYCGVTAPAPGGTVLLGGTLIPVPPVHMSLVGGAGALCATAADLLRWNTALTGGLAVTAASYDRMIGQGVPMATGLQYGFGLIVDTRTPTLQIWHNGSILGFQSMLLWKPEEQLTIAVLTNMNDPDRDRAGEIARSVARSLTP